MGEESNMQKIIYCCLTYLLLIYNNSSYSQGVIIDVPGAYNTIQEAINAAVDTDTILVAPGIYTENINFQGKNIVVTSFYFMFQDPSFIETTIIDGSNPSHPDTASVALFISGEDSSAILQGFTLTGGTGTRWLDEHGAGTYYEGGGILITLSSPTIKHNLIINNEAIRTGSGPGRAVSAGGGGIRIGDGNPRILNNVIMSNSAMYGGGIVLNYTGAIIKNNIIYNNRVYHAVPTAPTFGGGGIWSLSSFSSKPKLIENNLIICNSSSGSGSGAAGKGGGILVWSSTMELPNNIVWGNTQQYGNQIGLIGGASAIAMATYSNIEGGWTGQGNINTYPFFTEDQFYFYAFSPCVDGGNPDSVYNDPEDFHYPGSAAWPSQGTLVNDMGAYGGPGRSYMPQFYLSKMNLQKSLNFGIITPGDTGRALLTIANYGTHTLYIDSIITSPTLSNEIVFNTNLPDTLFPIAKDTIEVLWLPTTEDSLQDTLKVYHNAENNSNPCAVEITGSVLINSIAEETDSQSPKRYYLAQNYPNPFNPSTTISYSIPKTSRVIVKIYNILGEEIASLINTTKKPGIHKIEWNGLNNKGEQINSGIYIYQLKVDQKILHKKLILLK
jgi:hypothetical protein